MDKSGLREAFEKVRAENEALSGVKTSGKVCVIDCKGVRLSDLLFCAKVSQASSEPGLRFVLGPLLENFVAGNPVLLFNFDQRVVGADNAFQFFIEFVTKNPCQELEPHLELSDPSGKKWVFRQNPNWGIGFDSRGTERTSLEARLEPFRSEADEPMEGGSFAGFSAVVNERNSRLIFSILPCQGPRQ